MTKLDIELQCRKKADELLEKYFPNFVHSAAVERPETLSVEYTNELPYEIEGEFLYYLSVQWANAVPDGKPFKEVMNRSLEMSMVDANYRPHLESARKEAAQKTLWEKITRSNHEDVTFYKGLLKEYTERLLDTMIVDFMEDIPDDNA